MHCTISLSFYFKSTWSVLNEYKITFSSNDLTVTKIHLIQIPLPKLKKKFVDPKILLYVETEFLKKLSAHMNNVAFHITDV